MKDQSDLRSARAIRFLLTATVLLVVTSGVEAVAIRRTRADLQALRSERDAAVVGVATSWTRQPIDETSRALRWLDDFDRDPAAGFGRSGGACPDGRLDQQGIAEGLGIFLSARASGKSANASIDTLRSTLMRTDRYRAVHPAQAAPTANNGR
ncbi:MAG TPA: hypothetical protein VGI12_07355 [Vicinamibacterales bacterium]|jgi:hypothetical protein